MSQTIPEHICLLKHSHEAHDWVYTSSGGGHMLDEWDETGVEKNQKRWHCPGLATKSPCWRHDYEHREYVCTCDPPVEGDTGRGEQPSPATEVDRTVEHIKSGPHGDETLQAMLDILVAAGWLTWETWTPHEGPASRRLVTELREINPEGEI